jgi:site-specific recombinase XerD
VLTSPGTRGEKGGENRSEKAAPGLSIRDLAYAWTLAARAEAKSDATITIMLRSLSYFEDYLVRLGVLPLPAVVTPVLIRSYVVYLKQKPAFSRHPYSRVQSHKLSDQTVHGYCRALRTFFNWITDEGFIPASPFARIRLPRLAQKVIRTYSESEFTALLGAIDTSSPAGYRDLCLVLLMFDTAARSGEVGGMRLTDVNLEEGAIKVLGKGNRERLLPIGREVTRHLWRYIKLYRSQPANPRHDYLFLTCSGRRMTKNRLLAIVKKYSQRAGIGGIRCSPHTIRHTAALTFLKNEGDVFALQKLLGHTSLEMTRRYCLLSDGDLKKMHAKASPADNLGFRPAAKPSLRREKAFGKKF